MKRRQDGGIPSGISRAKGPQSIRYHPDRKHSELNALEVGYVDDSLIAEP